MRSFCLIFVLLVMSTSLSAQTATAVVPFSANESSSNAETGKMISEHVATFMAMSGYVSMVDRNSLANLIEEIDFQQSGLVDEATIVNAGKMIGAGRIITGSFSETGGMLKIQARIINVETSAIEGAAMAEGVKYSDVMNRVSVKLLDAFGVTAKYNKGYRKRKVLGISSCALGGVSLGSGLLFHAKYTDNHAKSKKLYTDQTIYDEIKKDGDLYGSMRLSSFVASGIFTGVGIVLLAGNDSEWEFHKKALSFLPIISPDAVGLTFSMKF